MSNFECCLCGVRVGEDIVKGYLGDAYCADCLVDVLYGELAKMRRKCLEIARLAKVTQNDLAASKIGDAVQLLQFVIRLAGEAAGELREEVKYDGR